MLKLATINMNKKFSFLAIVVLLLTISTTIYAGDRKPNLKGVSHGAETVILDITEFGAKPDSKLDACAAVKAALAKAKTIGKPVKIRFPKGRYDFFKVTAEKVHHPVTSVHQQWDHVTPFYLNGLKDITIDGEGSLFMMRGRITPMILYRCERINLVDFAIDQEFPSVHEARVVDTGKGTVDFRVHRDTRYIMGANGKPIWLNADGQQGAQPASWYQHNPLLGTLIHNGNPFVEATKVEEIQPSVLRCHLPLTGKYRKGLVYQGRWHIRNQQGSIILESRDVLLERVKLHTTNGLGILAQLSHNVTLKNVALEPRKETGRTAASFADCFHVCACTGTILVDNCRFVSAQDDPINIFGLILDIVKKESQRTLLLHFPSNDCCGFNFFLPGDKIGFRHRSELLLNGTNTVVSSELVDKRSIRLTLKNDVPDKLSDFYIESLTRIPDESIIRNSYFGCVSTRAILMNTSRKSLIEGNTFHRLPMSAILAKTPDYPYGLQNYIDGMTIKNNTFIECAGVENTSFTPGAGIINFNLGTQTVVPGHFPHRKVNIVGNRFINELVTATAIKARGVNGLIIRDNTFQSSSDSAHLVTLFGCGKVQIDGNALSLPNPQSTILYGNMKANEIKTAPTGQWGLRSK